MTIPYDEALGVHPQSEGYTDHAPWNFDDTPDDAYPLFLHYPYFDLYRKQVVKQADLVLALALFGDRFTAEEKARDFAYYEPLTVRDSSLSACTQAVIAAEVGHLDLAYAYMTEAALMDLDDLEHNSRDGVHMASLAGAWIAAVAGFGGMRDFGGELTFMPRLPDQLTRLRYRLGFRGRVLEVKVTVEAGRLHPALGRAAEDPPPRGGDRGLRDGDGQARDPAAAARQAAAPAAASRALRRPRDRLRRIAMAVDLDRPIRRLLPERERTTIGTQLGGLDLVGRAGADRPYVVTNFALTLDGHATIGGRSGAIGSDADTSMLVGLRTRVDAVMIGAGTMRAERYGPDHRRPRQARAARARRAGARPAGGDRLGPPRPALGRAALHRRPTGRW